MNLPAQVLGFTTTEGLDNMVLSPILIPDFPGQKGKIEGRADVARTRDWLLWTK